VITVVASFQMILQYILCYTPLYYTLEIIYVPWMQCELEKASQITIPWRKKGHELFP